MTLPIFMSAERIQKSLPIGTQIAEAREVMGFHKQTAAARESQRLQELDPSEYMSFTQQWLDQIEDIRSSDWVTLERRGRRRLRALEKITGLEIISKLSSRSEHAPVLVSNVEIATNTVNYKVSRAASAGQPCIQVSELPDMIYSIPKKLARRGLQLVLVCGDSMMPFAEDGETALCDTHSTTLKDGAVFIIEVEGEGMVIKRVQRLEGNGWLLISDNPLRPSMMPDSALVIGEVYAIQPKIRMAKQRM